MSEETKFLDNEIVVSMSNATYKGEVGPQGPQGEPGLSAYLVAVDNGFVGSEADWLATLVGPQGPQGPQGEPGPAGADGVIGRDGKSAYEIAVDYGFEGTEEEWIASIGETGPQGPKGDTGDTGPQGPKGDTGATGPKGDTGATGPKGDTPVKGVDYFTQQDIADIVAQIDTSGNAEEYFVKVWDDDVSGGGSNRIALNTITANDIPIFETIWEELNDNSNKLIVLWLGAQGGNEPSRFRISASQMLPCLCIKAPYLDTTEYLWLIPVKPTGVTSLQPCNVSFDSNGSITTTQLTFNKLVSDAVSIEGYDPISQTSNQVLQNILNHMNSTYATKTEVETAIRGAETGLLKRSVVQSLPNSNIDDNTIYMVAKTGTTGDVYDEYLYINNAWEHIGNTAVDLTGYATKAELFSGDYDDLTNKPIIPAAYTLPIATTATLGGVMVDGSTITADANGVISAASSSASYTAGSGINIDENDVISANSNPFIQSMLQMTTAGNDAPGIIKLTNTSTWDDFVDNIKAGKIVYINASTSYTSNQSYKLTPALLGITTLYAMNLDQISVAMMSSSVSSYPATGTQIYYQTYYYFDGTFLWSWKNPEDLGNFIKVRFKTYKNYALGKALDDINTDISAKFTAPTAPSTDGTYKLTSTISSGSASYAWAADSNSGGSSSSSGGIDIVTYDNYTNYINTTDPFLTISGDKITGLKIVVIKLKYLTTTMNNKRYTYSDDTPADIKQFVYNIYNNQTSYASYDDLENGYMLYFDFIDDNTVRPVLCSSVLQRYNNNNNDYNYGAFMFLSPIQHLKRQNNYNKPFNVNYTGIMWFSGWLDQSSFTCQIVKYPVSLSNFITPPSTTGTYTLQCNATESSGNKLYTYSWVAAT